MEYYKNYEKRYKAVNEAGIPLWGNSEKDTVLIETLKKWVEENDLKGKRVIEFACGEGSCGIILSDMGVRYYGVDIAPSAVQKGKERLSDYPDAVVEQLDMVKEAPEGRFDGALDVMGFHMLVTDNDRKKYLKNALDCLKQNAPMLFIREICGEDENMEKEIKTFDEFKALTENDYDMPQKRLVNGKEVYIPFLPARARSMNGYVRELEAAGFSIDSAQISPENSSVIHGVDIYARKTQ